MSAGGGEGSKPLTVSVKWEDVPVPCRHCQRHVDLVAVGVRAVGTEVRTFGLCQPCLDFANESESSRLKFEETLQRNLRAEAN